MADGGISADTAFQLIQTQLKGIQTDVRQVRHVLNGHDGHPGLVYRVSRLEQHTGLPTPEAMPDIDTHAPTAELPAIETQRLKLKILQWSTIRELGVWAFRLAVVLLAIKLGWSEIAKATVPVQLPVPMTPAKSDQPAPDTKTATAPSPHS